MRMKQQNVLIKLATILSSLLLTGGCVAYRSGALNWLSSTPSQPSASSDGSMPQEAATDGAQSTDTAKSQRRGPFLTSTKSPGILLAEPPSSPTQTVRPPAGFEAPDQS